MEFKDKNVINWTELSAVLTGEIGMVRSNFVPKKHKSEVDKLMKYVNKWCDKNRKSDKVVPRITVKIGNTVTFAKNPDKIDPFTKIKVLPDDCEKISTKLFKKGECYYTSKFSMKDGLDIREWYNIDKAKEYLND